MRHLLGIDFGGGASKATLLREDGAIAATHTVEYPTNYPRPGWAEQNPADWVAAVRENIAGVLQKSGVPADAIAAVCLDAATHTAVLMDENFCVLRPAIYWTDTRSTAEAAFLREQYGKLIVEQALHQPDTIWTLPQLLWVRKHEPGIWARTKHLLFAKDYVRYCLTGHIGTDVIEAQGSMLFDYHRMDWSPGLCAIADIPEESLPPLHRPEDIVGAITAGVAKKTGLRAGTPVLCGTTDTAMEVFASGAAVSGAMTVKLATAGRICVVTKRAYPHPQLVNYAHIIPGLWYPGTATKSCAASYRWFRDAFGGEYRGLDAEAAAVEPGCGGLMFHPYLNGELTPYADPLLRGSFTGVHAGHTKAYFSRAVLEGVALSLLDCKQELESIGIPCRQDAALIGGGARSTLWRQIVADTLGLALRVNETTDSSFGSAMLAGASVGVFDGLEDALARCVKTVATVEPNPANTKCYAAMYPRYRKIHDVLAPVYHAME